mgnify:CR=1 FL=1
MNLATIIDGHPAERPALICSGRTTSYGELREQVARFRGGLAALGVGDGDRVALLLGNNPHFVISYLATIGLGAIAVPLNPTSPTPEVEAELTTVDPAVVIVERQSAATFDAVDRALLRSLRSVVTTDQADGDVLAFDDLLAAEPVEFVDVANDHVAVLMAKYLLTKGGCFRLAYQMRKEPSS